MLMNAVTARTLGRVSAPHARDDRANTIRACRMAGYTIFRAATVRERCWHVLKSNSRSQNRTPPAWLDVGARAENIARTEPCARDRWKGDCTPPLAAAGPALAGAAP